MVFNENAHFKRKGEQIEYHLEITPGNYTL